ncbi:4-hydroxy-tetrahydrodipicolinate synthase [Paraburkholderia tropica]|uniref:4-hydroxy-tetrahydrodipicolinate synthase family protein n=1 Tax=Paraburkholderia tropica TaxID=92647 RepID=UPI001CAE01EA|nr:4-hydroxy-tetrahydrodipicolinate synthase [Paraburkholderia tropica]CAG9233069.1 4-hydroxy-tetrahydrodipicolinate synthase [Paraburkholderia tropica]
MFEGIWLPIVTPMRHGEVDIDALQALTEHYVNEGVDGLVALSTTGEAALLDEVERAAVLQAVTDVAAQRVPVLAGIGGSDTRAFVREMNRLEHWNVAGFLVSAPAYVCPDQRGVAWHFEQIARATARPIVLYDVPHRTGVAIEAQTVCELADIGNIVAIKACVRERFDALGGLPIAMLCGSDEAFLDCLNAGGTGGILAGAHVCGDLLRDVLALAKAARHEAAADLFKRFVPVLRLLFAAPNPSAIKAMLALEGRLSHETRMPIASASPALITRLEIARAALDDLRAELAQNA